MSAHGWDIEEGVRCVVCPACAFTFAAVHEDFGGSGYTCPNCSASTDDGPDEAAEPYLPPPDLRPRRRGWTAHHDTTVDL